MISHVTPAQRDLTYDPRAQQAAMPVQVHHRDGSSEETILILTPDQMQIVSIQVEQATDSRQTSLGGGPL